MSRNGRSRFPTAAEDKRSHDESVARDQSPQTQSPSYRLAFTDLDFLTTRDARPIRLQLELMKPEILLQEENIVSTIVVFGSARVPHPEAAAARLDAAEKAAATAPDDPVAQRGLTVARNVAELSRSYDVAREFGRLVSEHSQQPEARRYVVVTGGGPGIMEAANRGAHDVDAESIGLSIVLPHEQAPNRYITPKLSFNFHYFAVRKMHFLIRAEALACFPGGFGTLDELFEALTLIQTGKIEPMPVILFNEAWWRKLVNFDHLVESGTISPEDLKIMKFVETAEEGWRFILDFYKDRPPHNAWAEDMGP
ncbi:Decarboxylase family protein [Caenispirillum salinarum AK4]|uniref:AMP nucleosidase n=1 Tax=Caenispirillum salinarum AK4 TaxID=1238182 RepID=K9HQT0_9PROT|nr:TIGR00730 family Rossman fold protein [Caenispirillum salinarum]EKV30791.1 Decarboxylase family protein [Caenispirillum salinarum AK4]